MQSGFGVNFLFLSGEFQENCRRISQRILMANFDSEFSALFLQGFRPPKKIHAQNSRPELSALLSNFTFLNPKFIHGDFLLTGETKIIGGQKGPTKPKNRTNSTKEFSEQFEEVTGHYPVKQGF